VSSMAVAGLAKSLIAVTITPNPAAAHGPGSYTARSGDTLSAIAARAQAAQPTGPPSGGPIAARFPIRT
jgi:Tfp pilus assembly protein FimV